MIQFVFWKVRSGGWVMDDLDGGKTGGKEVQEAV